MRWDYICAAARIDAAISKENTEEAVAPLETALALDPNSADAAAWLR